MGQLVNVVFGFLSLDSFDIGDHSSGGKILGEFFGFQGVQMESGEGDELIDESEFSEVGGEACDVFVGHVEGVPVERWGKVVGQEFGWVNFFDQR